MKNPSKKVLRPSRISSLALESLEDRRLLSGIQSLLSLPNPISISLLTDSVQMSTQPAELGLTNPQTSATAIGSTSSFDTPKAFSGIFIKLTQQNGVSQAPPIQGGHGFDAPQGNSHTIADLIAPARSEKKNAEATPTGFLQIFDTLITQVFGAGNSEKTLPTSNFVNSDSASPASNNANLDNGNYQSGNEDGGDVGRNENVQIGNYESAKASDTVYHDGNVDNANIETGDVNNSIFVAAASTRPASIATSLSANTVAGAVTVTVTHQSNADTSKEPESTLSAPNVVGKEGALASVSQGSPVVATSVSNKVAVGSATETVTHISSKIATPDHPATPESHSPSTADTSRETVAEQSALVVSKDTEQGRQVGSDGILNANTVSETVEGKNNQSVSILGHFSSSIGQDYDDGELGDWSLVGFAGVVQAEQTNDGADFGDPSMKTTSLSFAPESLLAAVAGTEQANLDTAIRSFFANLDDMGKEAATVLTQFHMPAWLLSVAGFTMVAELTRRRTRSQRQGPSLGDDDQLTISTWYPALLGMTTTD